MDDDTDLDMTIPIEVRSNETAQMQDYIIELHEKLIAAERDELAEDVGGFAFIGVGDEQRKVEAETDAWFTFLRELKRLHDYDGRNRVGYLQSKLSRRVADTISDVTDSEIND